MPPAVEDLDLTVVTAVTPDYLDKLYWSAPTWAVKPQLRAASGGLLVFHNGFPPDKDGEPRELLFLRQSFPRVRFVQWDMAEADSQRERMLSAFVLGAAIHVKTDHWLKLDCDVVATDAQDVVLPVNTESDLVSHPWGYTKPAWWLDKLDCWSKGQRLPLGQQDAPGGHSHKRIISFACLHRSEFVRWAARLAGRKLPVPSHDTYLWWLAEHVKGRTWATVNMKARGLRQCRKARDCRETACAHITALNPVGFDELMSHIQLEITTACNLACPNCDRACGEAPSAERMTVEQVKRFVAESVKRHEWGGGQWRRIDILGGEPTLHPDLDEILGLLHGYAVRMPRRCQLRLTTNGTGERVKAVIAGLPPWVKVRNSSEEKKAPHFELVNMAPMDNPKHTPPALACSIPWRCGLALTPHGYFPCGAGAGCARVHGVQVGLMDLADLDPRTVAAQFGALCKYCGHSRSTVTMGTEQTNSPTWAEAFERWKAGVRCAPLVLYGGE